jgi:hypothetical protein
MLKLQHVLLAVETSRSHAYTSSIAMQGLIVLYQRYKNLPQWQMMEDQMSVFNEETGEQAFSVLARCVLGDSTKAKFAHLNKMYRLLHTYMSLSAGIRDDMDFDGPVGNWRKVHKPDGPETVATVAWVRAMLRTCKHNVVQQYNGAKGAYTDKNSAQKYIIPRKLVALHRTEEQVLTRFERLTEVMEHKHIVLNWADCMRDSWPEFRHQPADPPPCPIDIPPEEVAVVEDSKVETEPAAEETKVETTKPPPTKRPRSDSESESEAGPEPSDNLVLSSSDSDSSDDESGADDKKKSRDVDNNGDPVSWNRWGNVDQGNIVHGARSTRRRPPKKDDEHFPFVDSNRKRMLRPPQYNHLG